MKTSTIGSVKHIHIVKHNDTFYCLVSQLQDKSNIHNGCVMLDCEELLGTSNIQVTSKKSMKNGKCTFSAESNPQGYTKRFADPFNHALSRLIWEASS